MTTATPTLDFGALVTNFAPLITSATTAQPRGTNQGPPIDSAVVADIGNVLSAVLSSANPTPQPVPQPGGGTPNLGTQTTSSVGLDLGNVLSSVLGTTNLSQLGVPNLTGGPGSQSTTLHNLTAGQSPVGFGDGFDLGSVLSTVLAVPNPPCSSTSNPPDALQKPTTSSNLSSNSVRQQTPNFGAILSTFFNSSSATPRNQSGYIDEDVE